MTNKKKIIAPRIFNSGHNEIAVSDDMAITNAGESISNSEEKLKLIMNAALDAIICINTTGNITFWNPQAEMIFGWKETEALGRPLADLIIPEQYRKRHVEGMAHYQKTGKGPALNKLLELSAIKRSGDEFPIELNIMPIKQGNEEFFCAFIRDITERKKAGMALQAAYEEKNTILESIADAFFAVDKNWIVTYWNNQAEKMLDTPKSKIVGHNLWDVFSYSIGSASYKNYHQAIETNQVISFENYNFTVDKWYEISAYPSITGLSVYFKDITDRKKSDAAIKKFYDEKNTVLESIGDAFFAVDKNWIVTYWNKQAEKMLYTPKNKIVGHNLWEIFADSIDSESYRKYHQAIETNQAISFEDHYPALDKWYEISAYPSITGLSVYFKDITDRKKSDAAIKKFYDEKNTVLESIDDAFFAVDNNSIVTYWNKRAEILLETKRENIIGKNLHEVFYSRGSRIFYDNYLKAISEKITINFEGYSNITKKWFAVSAYGSENGLSVYFKDVTEQKDAEEKLKQSNERYNLISQATNDMVWDWNLETGEVYRNKEGWKKIFRTGDKEIDNGMVNDWDTRLHPDDQEKVKMIEAEIQTTQKDFFEVECRVKRDDGTYAYIHDRGYIIRNEQGKPVRLIGATQDITQRKEAEQQVAKSEFRFRSLVQNGSDLISIFNENAYFLYSSPAIKRLLGYEPEDTIEKNAFSFIHPDDIELVKTHLKSTATENNLKIPAFRFKNAKGEWRWLESKITDMCDNPEVQGYVFNSRDITERKIAEEEINKLSIIARETVNAVIITDPEGKIVWVNEAFTHVTEFELDEVFGKKPGDFLQGYETNLAVVRFMREHIANVQPFECDVVNYSKSGRKYWVRIQGQPQFDETGKLKYFFAIETDITKEKEAEEILRASEERYRYLFNHNPASIFIWDIDNFQILEVNDTAVELYGYCKEEFLTKTVFDMSPAEEHDKIKLFASKARQKPDFRSELVGRHINKAGDEMFMSISSHRIEFKGQPVILALSTNITDKVILENELEYERQLKQQEITEAVISAQEQERQELGAELHDNINQILAGSLLYLGLARKEITADHPYLKETDNLITSAIDEIRSLSHSLIPPSLIESELMGAVNNIIDLTQKTSGISIALQSNGFDESNITDKLKLSIYRIIQEQFTNILKHASAQKVVLRLTQDNEKTLLSIKDDGVGFDTSKKANGVGLMNIKTRASLFNGEMNIISSPGNGCELKVMFN